MVDLKFWKRAKKEKKDEVQRSMTTSMSESHGDVKITVAKGLSGTSVIEVTSWNPDSCLDLYRKVKVETDKP